jgi:hypothetical protein
LGEGILIDERIKETLRVSPELSDKEFMSEIKAIIGRVCKPCWEIKYCPYGPLVEDFPLLPPTIELGKQHISYAKKCLKTKLLGDGSPLDEERRKMFEGEVASYNSEDFVKKIPEEVEGMACKEFGHICPVFFVAEGFTETSKPRRQGRFIPFETRMRVVRRDNYTCQHCGKHLKDDEVEFDHIIPVSRGGSSDESNIRLTCFDCNREKSDSIEI